MSRRSREAFTPAHGDPSRLGSHSRSRRRCGAMATLSCSGVGGLCTGEGKASRAAHGLSLAVQVAVRHSLQRALFQGGKGRMRAGVRWGGLLVDGSGGLRDHVERGGMSGRPNDSCAGRGGRSSPARKGEACRARSRRAGQYLGVRHTGRSPRDRVDATLGKLERSPSLAAGPNRRAALRVGRGVATDAEGVPRTRSHSSM